MTASSSPRPHSSSTSSLSLLASDWRSGTAVPSQSKTTASNRRSSATGRACSIGNQVRSLVSKRLGGKDPRGAYRRRQGRGDGHHVDDEEDDAEGSPGDD